MPTPNEQLQGFLLTLNDEANIAAAAFRSFGHQYGQWGRMLAEHPEWRRFGTFEEMLAVAKKQLYNDPRNSRVIVEAVLQHMTGLPTIPGAELFNPLLEGLAYKVHADVLLAQEHYPEASESIEKALGPLSAVPALEIERGGALLVLARVQHALKHTTDALRSVREAGEIFERHSQFRFHQMALEICAGILVDQKEYALAQDVYLSAYVTAERLEDRDATLRLDTNLGACAVHLHQPQEALFRLKKALAGWQELNMHEAIQHTIYNLACDARDRGDLEEAVETLHNVFADFLDRKMPNAAAEVLVEIADTMTTLQGDSVYARTCHQLAETMLARTMLPENLREAARYLSRVTAEPSSVDVLHEAFRVVRDFLRKLTESPTTAFSAGA